jgi:DNA-binding XRE family transcriptional regulator
MRIDNIRVRGARERAGFSRERAALSLDKTYRTIEAYERGSVIPPGNVLVAMAALYGVTVEDLCSDEAPAGARRAGAA